MTDKKQDPDIDPSAEDQQIDGNVQQGAELSEETENSPPKTDGDEDTHVETPVDASTGTEIAETATASVAEEKKAETTIPSAEKEIEPSEKSEQEPAEEAPSDGEQASESHEEEPVDFEQYNKTQLTTYIVGLKDESNFPKLDRLLRQLKSRFDEIFNEERKEALDRFLKEEGAVEEDFEYKGGEEDQRFHDYYHLLREKKTSYFKQLEEQKETNLKLKNQILDQIREQVDGEESNISINSIKKLQDEWKRIGPVPAAQNRLLWASYNALLDRFYDARSIYFELKELDRKKNLQAKIEIVERAERLEKIEDLKQAIFQLNELHEEFKHVGPVPKENQEEIWQRLKQASDNVYAKRKVFTDELKAELNKNLESKQALAEKAVPYATFESDKISEWNAKSKEILDLQKQWETVRGLPRDKAKAINKQFWGSFKKFFNHKSQFFKQLESHKEENVAVKETLIQRAEELSANTDWDATAEALKKLQQEWRDSGPVPEKDRNILYSRFKQACDQFFEQRRLQNKDRNQEQDENLKVKRAVCEELEGIIKSDAVDLDQVLDQVELYLNAGFVPRQHVKKLHARFDKLIIDLINHQALSNEDRNELKVNLDLLRMKGSGNAGQKINRKENVLRRKIANLENDIHTFKTNMDFLASSKTADKLKADIEKRIEQSEAELENLQAQLKMYREL